MGYLAEPHITAEFFLTQVVSHHDEAAVAAFNEEFARQRIDLPGIFGVFYYRSANPRTLDTLKNFLPVPIDGLRREFSEGATPDEVCARTIRVLRRAGVKHFYVSNLPVGRARQTLARVMALADKPSP